jgi:DNA-binding MarR family transcriptional regulator
MQSLRVATNPASASACARELLDALPPVTWFMRRTMRSYRKGLSLPQFRALVLINHEPAVSLSGVADHLGASLPTASRIVAGLVRKGLISRQGCEQDRRQCELSLTARGRAVLETAWQGTQQRLADELAHLTGEDRAQLCSAMDVLKNVFGSLTVRNGK